MDLDIFLLGIFRQLLCHIQKRKRTNAITFSHLPSEEMMEVPNIKPVLQLPLVDFC